MPINTQSNDTNNSENGDELFFLLKSRDSNNIGVRNSDGLANSFFSEEDLGALQNAIMSQQLNTKEFKPGAPGAIKSSWANYLASGSQVLPEASAANGGYKANHTLSWDTNFSGTEEEIVRSREKSWASAVASAWNVAPQQWNQTQLNAIAQNGILTQAGNLTVFKAPGSDVNIKTGDPLPNAIIHPVAGEVPLLLTIFKDGFFNSIIGTISSLAEGPSLTKDEVFDYLIELSTTRSLAFSAGEADYYLYKSYYRYFDAETGQVKQNITFPGTVLENINKLYAPSQDKALELMESNVNSLYDIQAQVSQQLTDFESRLGKIVAGQNIVTGYRNTETQETFRAIPPESDPLLFEELSYNFSVYDEFISNMNTLDGVGRVSTILSGVQLNHSLITGLNFIKLPDTPKEYIGNSGRYLIVDDYETGIHFTGIEKIAKDLIDYGFELGSSTTPIEGLPGCITTTEDKANYILYRDQVITENADEAFGLSLSGLSPPQLYEACLFSEFQGEPDDSIKLSFLESNHKWAIGTEGVLHPKIHSTQGSLENSRCTFVGWKTSQQGFISNEDSPSQASIIFSKNLSITGVFNCN
jgi:hypothetical protein